MSVPATRRLAYVAFTLVFGALLGACGGDPAPGAQALPGTTGADIPAAPGNTVVATARPDGALRVTIGQSQSIVVTFTASEASATGLRVTGGLAPLPAGWSAASGGFTCASVAQDGACKLELTYAPPAAAPSGTLTLEYAYQDGAGQAKTGTFAVTYEAVAAARAYIVNYDDHNVAQCAIAADGALTACSTAAVGPFFRPTALAFNGSTAYVLNDGDDKIYRCPVGADGIFGTCTDSGAWGLDNPYGIAVHGARVYVSSAGNDTVTWCTIGEDGGLGDCRGSGDAQFRGTFNVAFHMERMYVVSTGNDALAVCDIAADGAFENCRDSGATLLFRPEGLAIAGPYAWLTNYGGRTVTRCTVGNDGLMSACANVLTTPWSASSIAVSGPHAYIPQGSDHSVLHCDVAADGALQNCSDSGAGGLNYPMGISLR